MSMSSLNEEIPEEREQLKSFQTVFDYMTAPANEGPDLQHVRGLTQEQREQYLITRNREALSSYVQMIENKAVDVDDSVDEKA